MGGLNVIKKYVNLNYLMNKKEELQNKLIKKYYWNFKNFYINEEEDYMITC